MSRNIHGVLIVFVVINMSLLFVKTTYTIQDFIAIGFGIIGLSGTAYLAVSIEVQKRRKNGTKEQRK
ncbi:hypothetical protein MUN89_06205 [Halobacillus salinarum]|uniref:Uncharacterized protein n=1 Tax=Halobacillus salinarum TaxID=2932257 RepID=A0ABY4EM59_9BACI|nr:hypothetical protein [Halobacillus salinarum]UOQ45534.1 hypothetical protein MUN89_06205 [Halobacillus salinarum]